MSNEIKKEKSPTIRRAGQPPSVTSPPAPVSERDRRWDEVLAATTPEQWEKLQQMFRDDEAAGTMPLDFTER